MNIKRLLMLSGLSVVITCHADICPDPNNSSLKWGEPPYPWVVNPFSQNPPQGEANTQFVKANILVAGYGRGVSCTYRNSVGDYSIWQETIVKIPPRVDTRWIDVYTGFVCTQSREVCEFYMISS